MSKPKCFIALIAFLACLAMPGEAGAQTAGPVYVVEEGDSLWGIAAQFGTSLEALAQANGLSASGGVVPGQQLVIPGFEGLSGQLVTHDVGFGQDLRSVAQVYGVDEASLLALNRGLSPERLYVGQPLIVPYSDTNPLALPEARRIVVSPGAALSELAIGADINPWVLQALNGSPGQLWVLPGDTPAIPSPGTPNVALPAPILGAELEPATGAQGRTLTVRLRSEEPLVAEGELDQWPLVFTLESAETYVALQGIHAMAEPGIYDLELSWRADGEESPVQRFRQPLRVKAGVFGSEALTVKPETIDPAVTGPEDALVQQLVTPKTAEKLWAGAFQFPSEYYTDQFPSVFGTRRSYNGEGYFKYHNGLDFYGGTGVPVLAPAKGRVVFAGPLDVRGNAIYIDHGWGVYTGYLHLSEILVEVGETVQPADEIGLVGATGRATGPHLHWEVWVGGVPVDPLEWVAQPRP
jgi:murein DD-endopeptidase MepM/ murein hydrolase activator NlpD